MGVTIENKYKSIDMSCWGFYRLRTKIAYLANPELGKFYKELDEGLTLFGDEREAFFKKYDKRLAQIGEEFNVSDYIRFFIRT